MVRALPIANPPNPWAKTTVEWVGEPPVDALQFFEERAKTIVNRVDSPDLGRWWNVNPYRGCIHGCAYCYARPTHQYWGFGAGTDFDRKIIVKINAPDLLREAFAKSSWGGDAITFSGNTDCYQPAEASFGITRKLLEVCLAHCNPVHVITKGALIRRDVDLLSKLARRARASVTMSIPFADDDMARAIEPYASSPTARFATMRMLADAGIEMHLNIAPVIPGLSDDAVPELLERGAAAGATRAALIALRLPAEVLPVFMERLTAAYPARVNKVEHAIRQMRGGKMNDSQFGERMIGHGPRWDVVRRLFEVQCARLGLHTGEFTARVDDPNMPKTFRRPKAQQELF